MHPQAFLKTFWRLELRPQVFVAMSFAPQYQSRYDNVIAPAISAITVGGIALTPHRVDISKNGDSILTEISDGIAHSRLVLADVSSIGKDSVSGRSYRNANVLYEVGLALACRHSSEVLLVRDDHDDFLFDVSTVPHKTIDFTNTETARQILSIELLGRIREQNFHLDARVQLAINSLCAEEVLYLKCLRKTSQTTIWGHKIKEILADYHQVAIKCLLNKQLIMLVGEFEGNQPAYTFTPLGWVVHKYVINNLCKYESTHLIDVTLEGPEAKPVVAGE